MTYSIHFASFHINRFAHVRKLDLVTDISGSTTQVKIKNKIKSSKQWDCNDMFTFKVNFEKVRKV